MPEDRDRSEPPGLWLRRLRESAGLTQEELAERAGLATRTISNLESGRIRRPHSRSLRMMANALDLSGDGRGELQARFRLLNDEVADQHRRPDSEEPNDVPSDEQRAPDAAAIAVPRQLPLTVPSFAGRSAEIAQLDQWLDQTSNDAGGPAIFGIGGMAGVGKTALALHWAHRIAAEFPDGQLHVSLGGHGQVGQPAEVADALGGFLVALGVEPRQVPATLEDRSKQYRRLLTGRRMLIMIDNAKDAAQVRVLAPSGVGCVVVATSRMKLADLVVSDGARLLNLDVLEASEAAQLLSVRLSADRVRDEPQAVQELIALCGRLPLALVIVAARAAISGWRLSVLATQLADERERLNALDLGDSITDIRSVFSWSCQQLNADATRLLRLLALHPGPDFAALAAASLAGLPARLTLTNLRELTDASLLTEHQPGRYRLHDLLMLYAAEQVRAANTGPELDAAVRRMLDHYLHTAVSAARLIDPASDFPYPGAPLPGVTAEVLATEERALSWLGEEYKVLMAVTRQAVEARFDDHAGRLAHAAATFLDGSGRWHDLADQQHIALTCAQRLDDAAGQARSHRVLGRALQRLGDTDLALVHLNRAISLLALDGDQTEQARAYLSLGVIYDTSGQLDRSLASCLRARDLAEAVGDRLLLATACNNIGYSYARLGHFELALEYCWQALDNKRQVGHSCLEATIWDCVGLVCRELGDFDQSIASYQRALDLFRRGGTRYSQADTLSHLGDAYQAAGEAEQAHEAWRQALAVLDELSHPDAGLVRLKLHGAQRKELSADGHGTSLART